MPWQCQAKNTITNKEKDETAKLNESKGTSPRVHAQGFGYIPNNLPLQTHNQGRASHQCSSNGLRKTISSEIDKFYANRK